MTAEVLPALRASGIAADSRTLRPGELFCALAGGHRQGLAHLHEVAMRGAVAAVYDPTPSAVVPKDYPLPLFAVPQLRERLGEIAARFYAQPARSLSLIGVTGTNGKTSCTQFLAQALTTTNHRAGVIGTLGYGLPGQLSPSAHTTPDPITLQRMLAELRQQHATSVALEVSSHGLTQGRVNGLSFEGAVFTNLTRDHLDYHGDMATYAEAKQRLFTRPELSWLVSNADDAYGRQLLALRPDLPRVAYGCSPVNLPGVATLELQQFQPQADTTTRLTIRTSWGDVTLTTPLLGRFNGLNLLAVLGVLLLRGFDLAEASARLARLQPVAGRLERFGGTDGLPLVVVDYAHTPDALTQALSTLRTYCQGQLYCVFGCGGDRDVGKRPLMGAAAESLSDHLILTDDNPRNEDGALILQDIVAGLRDRQRPQLIRDRRQAIQVALDAAGAQDVVLIAGKGHETEQIIGTQRWPFSDRDVVLAALQQHRVSACSG
jgi:UDP-N-acetylmuramoyl-L-alanyl-D-glutamate--2,6-diaminopimelate ligase